MRHLREIEKGRAFRTVFTSRTIGCLQEKKHGHRVHPALAIEIKVFDGAFVVELFLDAGIELGLTERGAKTTSRSLGVANVEPVHGVPRQRHVYPDAGAR